jgi:hypothetical protein
MTARGASLFDNPRPVVDREAAAASRSSDPLQPMHRHLSGAKQRLLSSRKTELLGTILYA